MNPNKITHSFSNIVTALFVFGVFIWACNILCTKTTPAGFEDYSVLLFLVLLCLRQHSHLVLDRTWMWATVIGLLSYLLHHYPLAQVCVLNLSILVVLACYTLNMIWTWDYVPEPDQDAETDEASQTH